jgi:hypothetical protein
LVIKEFGDDIELRSSTDGLEQFFIFEKMLSIVASVGTSNGCGSGEAKLLKFGIGTGGGCRSDGVENSVVFVDFRFEVSF